MVNRKACLLYFVLLVSGILCHDCREQCTSDDCIRPQDWDNVDPIWGILGNVGEIDCQEAQSIRLTSNENEVDTFVSREAVWEDFQKFQETLRYMNSGYGGNVTSGGDEGKPYRLHFFKFTSRIQQMEKGEPRITDVLQKQQDKTINYNNQAIVILQQDPVVREAAINLYYKHPDVSSMYTYDAKTKQFPLVAGRQTDIGKDSRIQVVAHGNEQEFAKYNGQQLARILSKLPGLGKEIGRIGLVGCEVGKSQEFLKSFLVSLKNEFDITSTVSARKGLLEISDSGRKMIGELKEDGIIWSDKNTNEKIIVKLDEHGNLIKMTEQIREHVKEACRSCGNKNLVDPSNIDKMKKIKITEIANDKTTSKVLVPEVVSEYLTEATKKEFHSDIKELFQTSRDAETLKVEYIDIYNNKVGISSESHGTTKNFEQTVGAKVKFETVHVFDPNREDKVREDSEVRVRRFENRQQFMEEINLWGLVGPLVATSYQGMRMQVPFIYYGIGKYIYRMNPSNFYIKYHGVSGNENWPFLDKKNRPVNYENADLEVYNHLWEKLNQNEILDVISHLLKGDMMPLKYVNPVDMVFAMASGFSETIRNFRNHPILKYQIELFHAGKITPVDFFKNNPMSRGGTWNIFGTNQHTRKSTDFPEIVTPFDLEKEFKNTGFYGYDGRNFNDITQLTYQKRIYKGRKIPVEFQIRENPVIWREIDIVQRHLEYSITTENKFKFEYLDPNTPNIETLPEIRNPNELKSILNDKKILQVQDLEIPDSKFKSLQIQHDSTHQLADTANTLKFELMFQMDQKYIQDLVAEDLQAFLAENKGDYFLVQDSVEIGEGDIRYVVQHKNNENVIKEISVKLDKSKLHTTRFFENLKTEIGSKLSEKRKTSKLDSATEAAGKLNDLLDVQGILAGFGSAIDNFENGNIKDGSIALAQSLHGSGTLVAEITGASKSIRKALGSTGKKILKTLNKSVSSAIGTAKQISTLGKAGKLLSKIPFVSLGFGIYSAIKNIQTGTTLGYINFGFDILGMVVSTAAIAFPPLGIVSLIIGVIQIGFNEFWNSISSAYKNLPPNATIGQKIEAVFKGVLMGVKSLIQQFTPWGQIWGAVEQSLEIDKQYAENQKFLGELRNVNTYYKVERDGEGHVINFAAGSSSNFGGDLVFRLGENGYATIKTDYQSETSVYIGNVDSVVAGFGQTRDIKYERRTAKFFWFIPVHSRDLISALEPDKASLRGVYYGNSRNNTFYTCQDIPEDLRSDFHYTLDQYTYKLFGKGGDDMFFLGPQNAHVEGGEGFDYYFIPEYGGTIYIDNYANDMKSDILYMNCSIDEIRASRYKSDLSLTYHASHMVMIRNWYVSDKYRHMTFRANDGVIFNVSQTAFGNPRVKALVVIRSDAKTGQRVNLNTPALASVQLLVGSNYSDNLIGNIGPNKLYGGKGNDVLDGGNGRDVYEVNENEGCDTINNYAVDEEMDTVIFTSVYSDISVSTRSRKKNDLFVEDISSNGHLCVTVSNWFLSRKYQHLTFLSGDGILFEVTTEQTNVTKLPHTISMKNDIYGSHTINISNPEFTRVRTVIGSQMNDIIIGNSHPNILNGDGGDDFLSGGEGGDSYVIYRDGGNDVIDNFAFDEKLDVIFFQDLYSNILISVLDHDLVLRSLSGFSVRLTKWFKSKQHQHMKVRSSDGIEFALSVRREDYISKIPFTIDKSESNNGVVVDTRESRWKSVIQVIGSNFTDVIYGNAQDNDIQPKQGGGRYFGMNGSDSYTLDSKAGPNNMIINNASDDNTDVISFGANFEDINVTSILNTSIHLTGPNDLGVVVHDFLSGTEYQHLIIESSDGISFGIDPETLAMEPIVIDKTAKHSDQVINIDDGNFPTAMRIHGSRFQPNEITGNLKDNTLVGGITVDTLKGNMGNDYIFGGNGQDVLMGGDGNDVIVGGEGSDWMSGDFGNDTLYGGYGADTIIGGYGSDTVVFAGNISSQTGVFVDLFSGRGIGSDAEGDIYIGVENIIGSEFDDILIGDDENNNILGSGGNDIIYPKGGDDVLNGGSGNDIYALESSHGAKYIVLESHDNSLDTLTLMTSNLDQVRVERYSSDHLVIKIGNKGHFNMWCPNTNNFGPFFISEWFLSTNTSTKDFLLVLNDTSIERVWIMEHLVDDINDFHKIICDHKNWFIAGICILVIVVLAMVFLLCFFRNRKNANIRKLSKTTENERSSENIALF